MHHLVLNQDNNLPDSPLDDEAEAGRVIQLLLQASPRTRRVAAALALALEDDDRGELLRQFLQENDDMKLIPQGGYLARLVRMKGQDGKDVYARRKCVSDTCEQVLLFFQIYGKGEHCDARVPWFGLHTERSQDRLLQVLRDCGLQGDDLATLDDQVLDREVWIIVQHKTSESGRVYAYVDSVTSIDAPF